MLKKCEAFRKILGQALSAPSTEALSEEPVSVAGRKCNTIYKGFAECLISLGDSMAQSVQQPQGDDSVQEQQELDTICKSWDDFHACATQVLSSCPEETANIWESLRQESRKIQFQGNLHDLCSSRTQLAGNGRASDVDETNKETLRGTAWLLRPGLVGCLTLVALVVLVPFA
ncbi:neuritin-like protein [Elgaria multicarinata webbii]|uniref:neuritin-like protein n=1 Tax=Elgaria multicarinata webbii TaxID=159646 RepID=UPI002FCCF37B